MKEEIAGSQPVLSEQQPVRYGHLRMVDVARVAGVSTQTVSRALNNTGRISSETRERILKVVEELGYHRNLAARTLVNRRSGLVGIVMSEVDQYAPRLTMLSIEASLRAEGYGVSLVSYDHGKLDQARAAVWQSAARGVEAIVLVGALPVPLNADERDKLGVPVVTIRGDAEDARHSVGIDQRAGAVIATRYLLDLGHESVMHLGGPEGWLDATLRELGWQQALQDTGKEVPPVELRGDWTAHSGYEMGRALIEADRVPGAIFAANDQMAMGVCRALVESGLRVPDDVSIVGYDDLPEAGYYTPPLTTVKQDLAALGARAAQLTLALIARDSSVTSGLITPELVTEGRLSVSSPEVRLRGR